MRSALPLVLWLALAGCRAEPDPFDTGGQDRDGDGAPAAIDCDDDSDTVGPRSPELCNGVDDDCDGLVDEADAEDATTWYADADGDGFGGPRFVERACVAPRGWVESNTDCDDGDSDAFPGAAELQPAPYGAAPLCMRDADGDGFGDADVAPAVTAGLDCNDGDAAVSPNADEVCDGVDTNCDGLPIEDELDRDRDRYVQCGVPVDGVWRGDPSIAGGDDCDNTDERAFPGATEVCDRVDNDCDGSIDEDDAADASFWYLDTDGDGFGDPDVSTVACEPDVGWVAAGTDCDDGAPLSYPGAPEVCDEANADNDCDGEGDEDDAVNPTAWFRDADADGWADLDAEVWSCDPPTALWIAVGPGVAGDCDDSVPTTNPGAAERCDGVDNDCDGTADGADAIDVATWALDLDGDGYGDSTYTALACTAPSGFVADATDCDDSLASVSPAGTESCNGIDDDCDGDADESDAVDAPTWYFDYDGDGAGGTRFTSVACEAPSGYVESSDDCDDEDAASSPLGVEICNDGLDNDCDATTTCGFDSTYATTTLDAELTGSGASAFVATVLTPSADIDGNGVPELLAGAVGAGIGGRVYAVEDPGSGGTFGAVAMATVDAESAADELGSAVAAADLNGDGYGDLVVGAPGSDRVGVLLGPLSGALNFANADAIYTVSSTGRRVGQSVAAGMDTDGDGVAELVIGGDGATGAGEAWLLSGPVSSFDLDSCSTSGACTRLSTTSSSSRFGSVLAGVGDLNADGIDELAVAAPSGGSGQGTVWVLAGPLSGAVSVNSAASELTGTTTSDGAGAAVVGGEDLDGDGYGDLVIGAPGAGGGAGSVYVVRGPVSGAIRLSAADAELWGTAGSGAGAALALIGDADGDGNADLAVGGPDLDRAWLVLGPITADAALSAADVVVSGSSGSSFGASLASPGDVDGDGLDELWLGGPTYAGPAVDVGAAWLLRGVGP